MLFYWKCKYNQELVFFSGGQGHTGHAGNVEGLK